MIFIYIQYITLGLRAKIPFRIVLYSEELIEGFRVFNIRPEQSIPKKIYSLNNLVRLELLASEPFCNSADELIDLFRDQKLIFTEKFQFDLLKSQFRTIGYNFNLKPTILWPSGKEGNKNLEQIKELISVRHPLNSVEYAEVFLDVMYKYSNQQSQSVRRV